ncbi:hypothetical protein CR513_11309 [Mucuna pruriens]|uniref:Uncharacterized protein n=1 Tax=Mucuna pruriens TaxID=157652 RepID=A0A371HQF5_MUCPR|nr:hypothetical protein CR513_11309 [Mucuna pruriens]
MMVHYYFWPREIIICIRIT